mgnify:CR=1 FL=1
MSEKNQTVVDWLENKLAENLKHIVLTQDHTLMASIFQEARKMEQDKLDKSEMLLGIIMLVRVVVVAEILMLMKKPKKD